MSGIDRAFARCRSEGRAAFIPFLMGGDPDVATCAELLPALVRAGADLIELGVPFSDPIADGPVIQRAAARALDAGATLSSILELAASQRSALGVPIVLFTYFNPVHAFGFERLARAAAGAVDGVLCVDLPPEEGGELRAALGGRGIASIQLIAPTSTAERIRRAAAATSGFLYYVSRAGVTGERAALERGLERRVAHLRRRVKLPVAVGFGVSTREQVEAIGRIADGVVVGSALVSCVADHGPGRGLAAAVERRARELSGRESRRR
jgi:tryptophan synthase alpha chain